MKKTTQSGKISSEANRSNKGENSRQASKNYSTAVSSSTHTTQLLYRHRDACNAKLAWDAELPNEMMQKLLNWEKNLRLLTITRTKRSLAAYLEPI